MAKTIKDEISKIKNSLKYQAYLNVIILFLFFVITIIIVFAVPKYTYTYEYEVVTFEIDPYSSQDTEMLGLTFDDNTYINKILCDNDGIATREYKTFSREKHIHMYNTNNETRKCMIEIKTKTRIIK